MIKSLFGKKESIEELIIKKPFDEKQVAKKLSKLELNKNNATILHLCAQYDCDEALNFLINEIGMNINSVNKDGENALFTAIKNKAINSCKTLLVNKINIEQENLKGQNSLHFSAKHGLHGVFNVLLHYAKDATKVDKLGRNILFYAVESKDETIIKKILKSTKIDINCMDKEGNTISHIPAISENKELFFKLIKLGLDIDKLNNNNEDFIYLNCLNLELEEELIDIVLKRSKNLNKNYEVRDHNVLRRIIRKILSIDIQKFENKGLVSKYQDRFITFLDHGIDVNSLNEEKENVLFDIVRARDYLTLDFILNRTKIDVNQVNVYGETLLDLALFKVKPKTELIKTLIYSNIDCGIKDKDGYSVIEKIVDIILSEALKNRPRKIGKLRVFENVSYNQILNLIFDYSKINIDSLTFDDEPLIFEIAKSFYVPLLDVLKKFNANLNIKSEKDGLNVFYRVLEAGKNAKDERQLFLRTLDFLVMNNVDIDCTDSYGGNVIHKAILDHDLSVINILTKKVHNYEFKDKKGRTYIHNTVWGEKVEILKKIGFKNKDLLNVPDKFGILPINYAVIKGQKNIVFTLIKLGAFLNNPNTINETFKEHFFSKLGRLDDILNSSMTQTERDLMVKLVASMQKEFNID